VNSLECYLRREDGSYFELGPMPEWRIAFAAFNSYIVPQDVDLLARRLVEVSKGYDYDRCLPIARAIIAWICNRPGWSQDIQFLSELDPEIEPGVKPVPITGGLCTCNQEGDYCLAHPPCVCGCQRHAHRGGPCIAGKLTCDDCPSYRPVTK